MEPPTVDNLRSCVRYTGWLATVLVLGAAVGGWHTFTGVVDWRADGTAFPWVFLIASLGALVVGALAGSAAQLARHELTGLVTPEVD